MICDLYSSYYDYKVRTLNEYTLALSKIIGIKENKLFNNQRLRNDFWPFVIKDYLNRYVDGVPLNKYLVKGFLNDREIQVYELNNEVMSVIDYLINKSMILDTAKYKESIILAGFILKIANTIDILTSPFTKNQNNYSTLCINAINEANKIKYINLIDDGKKETNKLLIKVKENVKRERKFFESLTSVSSFNKYIDISKENIYYLAQYNYRIPNLNKYDEYAVKDIYDNLGVDDVFALISANLMVSSELKLFSIRRPLKILFLPLRKSFFDNEKNVKELSMLFKNNKLHRYIKILVNYNEAKKEVINLLKRYKLDYYLYCSRNSEATTGKLINDVNNYLVSKEFYDNNKNIISKWKNLGVNIIKEEFDGIVTDTRLLVD